MAAAAGCAITVVVGAVAWWWLRIVPRGGVTLELEVAYWQLVVGVVATVFALGALCFGVYAVEQVRLARRALEEDREARRTQARALARQVLIPLTQELHHNRLVLLQHLGWAKRRGVSPKLPIPDFKDAAFRTLTPQVWGAPMALAVWSPIQEAYEAVHGVQAGQHPEAAYEGALGFVERGIEAIYTVIADEPPDWDATDAGLASGYAITRPRVRADQRPERARNAPNEAPS